MLCKSEQREQRERRKHPISGEINISHIIFKKMKQN